MVWHILYFEEQHTIVIKTGGDIAYQELPQQFSEAVRLAREKETDRYLFDDTELHINVSTVDIYELPKMILAAGISRTSRIAVVVSPEENRLDNYRFLETVCVNQGLHVKVFLSHDEAYQWLNK
jgi:hypothetical protein